MFVTSQGHPYAIFRRALERGNLAVAWATAAELQVISLADALALCLLVREREPPKYARLALRWHARFCTEVKDVGLDEARLVLELLAALGGPTPRRASNALREFLASYDQALAEPLRRWQPKLGPEKPSPANPKAHGT